MSATGAQEASGHPSSETRPKRSRQHASLSCYPCRSRKHKCGGQRPICSGCIAARTECTWPPYDGRRTIPFGEHWDVVQRLQRRIECLAQLLLNLGIQPPDFPPVFEPSVDFPKATSRRTNRGRSVDTTGSPRTDTGCFTPTIEQPERLIPSSWLNPALMQRQNHALHVGNLSPYLSPALSPSQTVDANHSPYVLSTQGNTPLRQMPGTPAQSTSVHVQPDHFEALSGSGPHFPQECFWIPPPHVTNRAAQQNPNAERVRSQKAEIGSLARVRQSESGMPPFAFQFSRH